jgi:short-subunit dehydrogenase
VDLGLKDATAVVAGGGGGMGLAAARCLADDGARVAIVGRTKDILENAAKDLTGRRAQWARIVNFSAHSTQRQSVILSAYTAPNAAGTSIASEALAGWAQSVSRIAAQFVHDRRRHQRRRR